MVKKWLVCYLGMGNSFVFEKSFDIKQDAVDSVKNEPLAYTNSSLEGERFFIIEAFEINRSTDE